MSEQERLVERYREHFGVYFLHSTTLNFLDVQSRIEFLGIHSMHIRTSVDTRNITLFSGSPSFNENSFSLSMHGSVIGGVFYDANTILLQEYVEGNLVKVTYRREGTMPTRGDFFYEAMERTMFGEAASFQAHTIGFLSFGNNIIPDFVEDVNQLLIIDGLTASVEDKCDRPGISKYKVENQKLFQYWQGTWYEVTNFTSPPHHVSNPYIGKGMWEYWLLGAQNAILGQNAFLNALLLGVGRHGNWGLLDIKNDGVNYILFKTTEFTNEVNGTTITIDYTFTFDGEKFIASTRDSWVAHEILTIHLASLATTFMYT